MDCEFPKAHHCTKFLRMKHPFQIVLCSQDGKYLFCTVKNNLLVYSRHNGKLLGSWTDTVNVFDWKQLQENKKALELLQLKPQTSGDEKSDAEPVKPVKVPLPGPGAPPMFNYIRSLALSSSEKFLVGTTDSDKAAIVFSLDFSESNCLQLVKRQVFPKRPCLVAVDGDARVILADKFGDVYAIDIDNDRVVDEKSLVPILGHVSMLGDIALATHHNKRFILSADRDEHIRVSNYPKSFVVRSWLFGHHEFVSALHIPKFDPNTLISGGGDDYLCVWNWYDEKLKCKVQLRELVLPFLLDAHLPPERFLKDDSPREIAVANIITYSSPSTDKHFMLVLIENTSCILSFEIDKNWTFTHQQTFPTLLPVVAMAIDPTTSTLIVSKEAKDKDCTVSMYKIDEQGQLLIDAGSETVCKAIEVSNVCDVQDSSEFYPLYYINTLRKRSEH